MPDTITISRKKYDFLRKKAKLADDLLKNIPEPLETYLASQKTLAKDWSYKGDDVWNDL